MKVAFYTLGCKVNQYETDLMKQQFIESGYDLVNFNDIADIYVINSCSVTNLSTRKTRQFLSKARSINLNAIIVLAGCSAQEIKDEVDNKKVKLLNANLIIGNEEKNDIVKIVEKYINENIINTKSNKIINFKSAYKIADILKVKNYMQKDILKNDSKIRADIKIEDGCNNFCSYCIIPYVRGPIRSRSIDDIEKEAISLVKNGIKEIVLVGIEISSYGKDLNSGISLIDVIEKLNKINGLCRIRLGSLYPTYLTDEIIERLSKIEKLCHHFHLSVQSLDDSVLKAMNRRYSSEYIYELTEKMRKKILDVAFTCDIIVGFPGETDDQFNNTVNMAKKINFSHIHVFKYSKRKYTKAINMENQVDGNIAIERSNILLKVSDECRKIFLNKYIGKNMKVLIESYKNGCLYGYTSNYIKVKIVGDKSKCLSLQEIKLVSLEKDIMLGKL